MKKLLLVLVFFADMSYSQWVQMNNGLGDRFVLSLTSSGNYLFAGTFDGYGVYLSSDNGITWTQTSLNNRSIATLLVNGNNIFAGTFGNGVYISTNNGSTWSQTSLDSLTIHSLATNGSYIFIILVIHAVLL